MLISTLISIFLAIFALESNKKGKAVDINVNIEQPHGWFL